MVRPRGLDRDAQCLTLMSERARVGVLISGRGSNMAALVDAAEGEDCPFEIVLVAANVVDAPGLRFARERGIPTFAHDHRGLPRAEFDALLDHALRDVGAEWVALAGYMRLLSPSFIAGWRGRIVNIHPSLLPKYKGLHTHQRALDAGDAVAGCSVHLVTEALDDGPVLGQARVPVLLDDTAEDLATRVLVQEHALYPRVLADLVSRRFLLA